MKLRYGPTSPFVRKVLVVACEAGLEGRLERIATKVWAPESDIGKDNPLGKIPALILDDGSVLYDSPVICAYLASLNPGAGLVPEGKARWQALKLEALADGILDAAIARRHESARAPERQEPALVARYAKVMARALEALEAEAGSWDTALTIGQIAAGVACGYLDFRFGHEDWREGRPRLAAWYERFSQRPSMQASVPKE